MDNIMDKIEYVIDFTDITLSETDGAFKEVEEIMVAEPPFNDKWVIRSFITIMSTGGVGSMEVQCHGDGKIYITDYHPSIGDLFYNPDIQVISMWAQKN